MGYEKRLDVVRWCVYVRSMPKAPRLSVTITEPLRAFLEREAERLGITMGELIRRILDQYRAKRGK